MAELEQYDILVLGGGKGGKTLAMEQATAGRSVAVVEAGLIGGSCINVACIPSKALIRSAQVVDTTRNAAAFGVASAGLTVDMAQVARRTADVVAGMVDFNLRGFQRSGVELVIG